MKYERLRKHLDEVRDALMKIRKGEFELKRGRARIIKSLSELRYWFMTRSIEKIYISSEFKKSFRKLSIQIQVLAEKKDPWFRKNAFDARLRTHKLRGELEGYWSYSINYQHRILFRFINDNEVIYYDIGAHDIYK